MCPKKCPIYSNGKKLPSIYLPTYGDIWKYFVFLNTKLDTRETDFHVKFAKIVDDITKLWEKAGISTVSRQRIGYLIKSYSKKFQGLVKSKKNIIRSSRWCFHKKISYIV